MPKEIESEKSKNFDDKLNLKCSSSRKKKHTKKMEYKNTSNGEYSNFHFPGKFAKKFVDSLAESLESDRS